MNILGLWDGHDSGAALLIDGEIAAAANEERFTRRKLEVAFPFRSIEACLQLGSIAARDVDRVAISTTDPAKALGRVWPSTKESYYRIRRRQAPPGALNTLRKRAKYWITELAPGRVSHAISRRAIGATLKSIGLSDAAITFHDHHACHAAGAAAASGFERAIVLTIDGVGDGAASTVSVLDEGKVIEIARTDARHSPGIFFEHVTNLLNMRELEDEGKVMALASYAPAPASNPLRALLGVDGLQFQTSQPGHALHGILKRIQWSVPNEQFARMAQDALESAVMALVQNAVAHTGIHDVAMAGGVASNIQINRRIRLLPEVDRVFVFPHMGDGGLALGAALRTLSELDRVTEVNLRGLSLGPAYSDAEIEAALREARVAFTRPDERADAVVELLTRGKAVMWFEGRMEYGPRALGHRSILARADDPAMRDRLNLLLKRRVWYQPFCPSILESDAKRLLCDWRGCADRFMTMSYAVKGECQRSLAAVIGVDGTCRPQIVADDDDGPFADLLRAMKRRTGTGAVLNTSFNIHGEPLVCTPSEAIDVFLRSGADALMCGPFLALAPP